jgi:hypothetical protein
MLNITTAKPFLIEIDRQIKERTTTILYCAQIGSSVKHPDCLKARKQGMDIADHLIELKELRYQLAMTPERVDYLSPILPSQFNTP